MTREAISITVVLLVALGTAGCVVVPAGGYAVRPPAVVVPAPVVVGPPAVVVGPLYGYSPYGRPHWWR
jgi:hypothetical protein